MSNFLCNTVALLGPPIYVLFFWMLTSWFFKFDTEQTYRHEIFGMQILIMQEEASTRIKTQSDYYRSWSNTLPKEGLAAILGQKS